MYLIRVSWGRRAQVQLGFASIILVISVAMQDLYTYLDVNSGEPVDSSYVDELQFGICWRAWNQYVRSDDPPDPSESETSATLSLQQELSSLFLANAIIDRLGPPKDYRVPYQYFINGCLDFHGIRVVRRWMGIVQDDRPPWQKTTISARRARNRHQD